MNIPSSGIIETMAEDVPWDRWRGVRFRGRNKTLRVLAVHILAFWVIDMVLGMLLTGERVSRGPYTSVSLALHITIGLLIVGMSTYALIISLRSPGWRIRVAAILTFISVLGASVAGVAFMYGGENMALVNLKGVLGGLTLVGTILMLAWARPRTYRWNDD